MSNITDLAQRVRHWADMAALTDERVFAWQVREPLEKSLIRWSPSPPPLAEVVLVTVAGFTGCGKGAIAGKVRLP
jgi:hypothetical protein